MLWQQKVELYSPPKTIVQKVVALLPNKSEKTGKKKTETYEQTAFHNARILFKVENTYKAAKPLGEHLTQLVTGTWYSDDEVKVTVWATEEGTKLIKESEEEAIQWTANVRGTSSKNGKITLLCDQLKEYAPVYDMDQNELLQDDFILTNKECSYCNNPVTFKDMEKGTMMFDTSDDYVMCCPDCYDKYENVIL
jgi:hypothetical protein